MRVTVTVIIQFLNPTSQHDKQRPQKCEHVPGSRLHIRFVQHFFTGYGSENESETDFIMIVIIMIGRKTGKSPENRQKLSIDHRCHRQIRLHLLELKILMIKV